MSRPVDYAALTEKRCSKCGETKPVSEFSKSYDKTAVITGWRYQPWCKQCQNARSREYGAANRERRNTRLREWRRHNPEAAKRADSNKRRNRYGLTVEQEAEALAKFEGMCWLCRTRPARNRDHDHDTGEFRGMLCNGCNTVTVARADADPDYLTRVDQYIKGEL